MMIHQILFLCGRSSFAAKALANSLDRAGYDVRFAEAQAKTPERGEENFDAAVLFLDSELLKQGEALSVFGGLCAREKKPLLVIGTQDELDAAGKHIPREADAERVEKPVNIRELLRRIHQPGNAGAAQEESRLILLVDDDPDYLKIVSRWLSGKYRVAVVNSGMQAITFLGANRPDLILLDYNMPVASGPQVLEMIRSEPSTEAIPVFFLTGKDDSESVNRVLEFKPEGYILKDISRDSLMERLERFFAGAA